VIAEIGIPDTETEQDPPDAKVEPQVELDEKILNGDRVKVQPVADTSPEFWKVNTAAGDSVPTNTKPIEPPPDAGLTEREGRAPAPPDPVPEPGVGVGVADPEPVPGVGVDDTP
jgi:hypothetical protein